MYAVSAVQCSVFAFKINTYHVNSVRANSRKMIRVKTLTVWLFMACAPVKAFPTACSELAHCPLDSFCDASLLCRECLRCDTLKREPPRIVSSSKCITTVTQCGSCFKGLVENGENVCVSPQSALDGIPPYEWAAVVIGLAVLLALLLCAIAAYLLRNFRTFKFKILTPTRTAMEAFENRSLTLASAPAPPPYSAVGVPPSNPNTVEESSPFIEMIGPLRSVERISAGSQAARVFGYPAYVRGPELPPSYETSTPTDETNEPLAPVEESNSTDDNVSTNVNAAPFGSVTTQVTTHNAAAAPTLSQTQDSNNNSGEENTDHNRGSLPSFSAHGSSAFVINVIKNVTTVQQHNEVTRQ